MALHDYRCPACGTRVIDHYVSCTLRASEQTPTCACGTRMEWIPQVGAIDAKEPFQQFQAYLRQPDGTEKLVTVGSLHQMRQIERESEQRAKDGEGQQMVWRDYSQDRNHRDRHSFAEDPALRPTKTARISATAVPESAVEDTYGPGVSDSNTTALGVE